MSKPYIGHGAGLRVPHYERALEDGLDVDWVECISENFFGKGGRPRAVLKRLRRDMPIVFHGVSMGIASKGGPSAEYLGTLKELVTEFEPAWVSDHLCWTHFGGAHSHDLLPVPYTEETLTRISENVARVQHQLRRPLVLENVSSYVGFQTSTMSEWEFLSVLSERTGCKLLLDLNNVVVSARNHGFKSSDFLHALPTDSVWQFHLANHEDREYYKFDSHAGPVPSSVWDLYKQALQRFGRVSSLVEWDEDIPEWSVLKEQQRKASALADEFLEEKAPA